MNAGKPLYLILTLILYLGCSKDSETVIEDFNSDYFPFSNGHTLDYNVTEIIYDDFFQPVKIDTNEYQLRVRIDSVMVDELGNKQGLMFRSFRNSDTADWRISDVWLISENPTQTEVVEENVSFVKLIYPARSLRTWDGNARNILDEQRYIYTEVGSIVQWMDSTISNVVKVEQNRVLNLIEDESHQEWYAEGLGLIYKLDRSLRTSPEGDIESGEIVSYKLRSYGTK